MGDVDHIRIAVALSRSARWVGVAAIAITTALILSLFIGRPLHTLAALASCLGILSGAAAIYLMVRVELDRSIFQDASGAGDLNAYFAAFDQSRSQLELGEAEREARPVAERARGLVRLVRTMGYLFAVQMFFALAGVWMGRWLS